MGAPDLLQHLRDAGLSLTADGDRLTVTPRERLTDAMRDTIRANKAALLDVLKPSQASPARHDLAETWTGQELDPQDLAHARLIGMGLADPMADKLAKWMMRRDETGDAQITCYECRNLVARGRRCSNHVDAGVPRELGTDLATKPQRCPGFMQW